MHLIPIESLASEILLLKQQTASNIIEIGKRLNQAKEMLPHGEWGKWLEEKVEFHQATATRFMRAAKEFSNFATLQNLTSSKIFALLDVPQEEREQFIQKPHELPTGQTKTVDEMTTRELQEAIKAKKAAEKAKLEAEEEAERLKLQVKQLQDREPEVIEKVIEKEVVPPQLLDTINTLKNQNKELSTKTFQLESKVIQLEEEEKHRFQKARLDKKALDQEFNFLLGKMNVFLKEVSGYIFLADALLNMEEIKAKQHEAAIDQIGQWVNQMKKALPTQAGAIEIEGVVINE